MGGGGKTRSGVPGRVGKEDAMSALRAVRVICAVGLLAMAPSVCSAEDPPYHPPGTPVNLDHPVRGVVAKPNLFFVGGRQIVGEFTAVCDEKTGITRIDGRQWIPAPTGCPEDAPTLTEAQVESLYGRSAYLRRLLDEGTLSSWREASALVDSLTKELGRSTVGAWGRILRDGAGSRGEAEKAVLDIVSAWPLLDPESTPRMSGDEVLVRMDGLSWDLHVMLSDPLAGKGRPRTAEEIKADAEEELGTLLLWLADPTARCVVVYSCWATSWESGGDIRSTVEYLRRCHEAGRYLEPRAHETTLQKREVELILANTESLDLAGW
jgi:hypothetical protein